MEKLLTIVIPTYNMEKYLHKCLNSLVVSERSMQLLEVLVINDGSKDSSSMIGHEYESKYPNIFRVIDKENGNYGSCVNRGLKEARGKYIKILDADDYFDTIEFDKFIIKLIGHNEDLILSDYRVVNTEGVCKYDSALNLSEFKTLLMHDFYYSLQMHQVMYKTENLRNIGYHQTEGISYTDREWVFWPMISVKTICYLPYNVYYYLVGREGQTMDLSVYVKGADQEIQITKKMVDLWTNNRDNYGEAGNYINKYVCERLNYLIFEDIIRFNSVNQKKYIEMDKYLKETYPEFYQYSSDHCVLGQNYPYKFLKAWRKNYSINIYNPYILFYRILKSLK